MSEAIDLNELSGDPEWIAVMSLLLAHLAPMFPEGSTLTLIVDDGNGQEIYTNDDEVTDLIVGIATDMIDDNRQVGSGRLLN